MTPEEEEVLVARARGRRGRARLAERIADEIEHIRDIGLVDMAEYEWRRWWRVRQALGEIVEDDAARIASAGIFQVGLGAGTADMWKETEMGKNEPTLDPVTVTISGKHDSGKTTLANLIKEFLKENDYRFVAIEDTSPLPADEKDRFSERFSRNRDLRAVNIRVVLEE
jgi:hypothetical protein